MALLFIYLYVNFCLPSIITDNYLGELVKRVIRVAGHQLKPKHGDYLLIVHTMFKNMLLVN